MGCSSLWFPFKQSPQKACHVTKDTLTSGVSKITACLRMDGIGGFSKCGAGWDAKGKSLEELVPDVETPSYGHRTMWSFHSLTR